MNINPMNVHGSWTLGYVLEKRHTVSSTFLGYRPNGKPQFSTIRSHLGELTYRLKYRDDRSALDPIAEIATTFIKAHFPCFDQIIPIPPSKVRAFQPVEEIAKSIGSRMSIPVITTAVTKIVETSPLKDIADHKERFTMLSGAFEVDIAAVCDRRVLLVDDLYESGATATTVTNALHTGGAVAVFLLAITKTNP